ncbi:unnamed protein product [Closterium sp. NIES-54]
MATQKERNSSNGSPGTTPTPPPASGLQTEEGTATRPRATSSETPANQAAAFDPDMMEKFFSFISFYEQHQQGAHAQSNNSNNATPMRLDGSSYARGNQQQPTFAPYEPQRGSVSFMPHPQPASGQEKTLDALQVQLQFAHVLKMQTTRPFDGKDFFTWSFEFELMMEGAQILGFFDGSLPYPTHDTQYDKQQYTYQSMMAYTILLRNITPNQQQNIRSYRGYGNSAELTYNHLKNLTSRRESLQPNPTYAAIAQSEPSGKDTWFLDSCCGQHMCSSGRFVQREHQLQREVVITVANNKNLRTRRQGVVQLQSRETNVILQMSKVLIAEGLGYNLLSVSQLMAKGIHLEADSTTQEFKLYNGKGGLYIGKAVLKNNVFVLDFVPDLGTADSDGIVTFTSWTHPPDLDPDFSPEGFWYSHTIPETERTRALATIQHSAAAEPTPAAAETTPAAAKTTLTAAETTLAAAETTAAATATSTPIAGPSPASAQIDDTPPTPAQLLNPTP